MHNHAPKNYVCPFCNIETNSNSPFIIYKDEDIAAIISSNEWPPNSGIVLVLPVKHYENLYDIPDDILAKIEVFGKKVAIAMREGYKTDGISTRQHNEPAGYQTVWHYHLQVVPRYNGDKLYGIHHERQAISDSDRAKYAEIMKKHLK